MKVHAKGNRVVKVTRRQRGTFEVSRAEKLPIAKGDRLLIRGPEDTHKLSNGDLKTVAQIEPETNGVVFTDGSNLPENFHAWTYAHALTSYRAQGSTAEESMLVLGAVAERALTRRHFMSETPATVARIGFTFRIGKKFFNAWPSPTLDANLRPNLCNGMGCGKPSRSR